MPNCKNCGHSISNTKKWEKSPTGYVHSNRSGAGRGIKCSILDQTVAGPLKYLCGCIRPEPFQEDFESAEQAEQQREEEWNQKQKQEQKKWEEEKKGIYINLPEEEGEVITKLESILNAPFRLDYSPFESCGEFSVEDGHVTKISLWAKMTEIPEIICSLPSLQQLVIDPNNLSTLPTTIGNLSSLTVLFVSDNQLSSIPESVGDLKMLRKLYLYNNKLTSLPEGICRLPSLEILHVADNQLSSLPAKIGDLASLRELRVSQNQLSLLPESIGNLCVLQTLSLDSNQLICLPESFGNLKSLQKAELSHNKLNSLPESFSQLGQSTRFKEIDLRENPLKSLPQKIEQIHGQIIINLEQLQILSGNLPVPVKTWFKKSDLSRRLVSCPRCHLSIEMDKGSTDHFYKCNKCGWKYF